MSEDHKADILHKWDISSVIDISNKSEMFGNYF